MFSLENMTLEEKVGQMFMCGIQDQTHLETLIKEYNVGGIIYFNRNVNDALDSLKLSKYIKTNSKIPAFISVDQEGGIVSRIKKNITEVSGNMAISATDNKANAKLVSKILAEELLAVGINMNLAPVVDINNNPENPIVNVRSFGETAERVIDYSLESLKAYKELNMFAVAKHFPGHGDTDLDSHTSLPILSHDEDKLRELELKPYLKMIPEGLDAIMVSHILFSNLSNDNKPASLSYNMITNILRNKLGYRGLIMTDCLEMQAISDNYGLEEASIACILAGADIALISHTLDYQEKSIKAVIDAVNDGIIDIKLIDNAVERILRFKQEYNINNDYLEVEEALKQINTKKNNEISKQISLDSITLVKDINKRIPLINRDRHLYILPKRMQEFVNNKNVIFYDLDMTDEFINEVIDKSASFDIVIFASYNMKIYSNQQSLLSQIDKDKCILVALESPYDINYTKDISTYICCYEITKNSVESLFKVLNGEYKAIGKLPITLNGD